MNRRSLLVSLCGALVGCASREFKPLEFAPPLPLQDALPGLAIVYLLRAPHDSVSVNVALNSIPVAGLPSETYTAVSLQPGTYTITTAESSGSSISEPDALLTVAAGERRFLYTSVPTRSTDSLGVAFVGKVGVVPLLLPVKIQVGRRTWHECNELDAQGLMSISKLVAPKRQQL